jgi:hypothetical protein
VIIACGLRIAFALASLAGMVAMQSIATTTDDLENREINAAEIHGVHPKWAYGGGAVPELKEFFDRDYRNIILDLRGVRLADRDSVRFLRCARRME